MVYNDPERLRAVERFLKLDINRKEELQEMVELASALCHTPVAMISLMDEHAEHFHFKVGTEMKEQLRKDGFCQHLLDKEELIVVPNALLDVRFANNPLVIREPHIRFYAGFPLVTHDGYVVGSLCVMGMVVKQLTEAQKDLLKVLAKRAVEIIEIEFGLEALNRQFLKAKDSEIKLQSFFESKGICYLLIGRKMEVIAFNKNVADFLALKHHVKLYNGITISQILSAEQLEIFMIEYDKALAGDPVFYEREVDYSGEIIWWSIALEPGYNKEGEIIGISYNATNITEKKFQEQEIIKKNKLLMEIAHIQSHELRKPVASILGLVELFRFSNYTSTIEELMMLEKAANDLDDRIRAIVALTE